MEAPEELPERTPIPGADHVVLYDNFENIPIYKLEAFFRKM